MNGADARELELLGQLAEVESPVESRAAMAARTCRPEFAAVHSQTQTWLWDNRDLCEMHDLAVEDYVASRHAVLQLGLFKAGLAVAAQAVERFFKCYLLASGIPLRETRNYNHNIRELLERVVQVTGQQELLAYLGFSDDLEKWYNARYPDASKNKASSWQRNAIEELDRLVSYLEENMPMPATVAHLKYGGGELGARWSSIFVRLFGAIYSQHNGALLLENAPLQARLGELKSKYFEARMSAAMPSTTLAESVEHTDRLRALIEKYEKPPS